VRGLASTWVCLQPLVGFNDAFLALRPKQRTRGDAVVDGAAAAVCWVCRPVAAVQHTGRVWVVLGERVLHHACVCEGHAFGCCFETMRTVLSWAVLFVVTARRVSTVPHCVLAVMSSVSGSQALLSVSSGEGSAWYCW
jgi:hypothetical protein